MRTGLKTSIMVFILTICSLTVFAQGPMIDNGGSILRAQKPDVNLRSMSLLDPSRFTMRQESVFSYSSGNMAGSNMMGMYINTMEYRFNMPLTMRLKVAYQNNVGSLFGNRSLTGGKSGIESGRVFVPSFDMVYQPKDNFVISFHYRDYSGMSQTDAYGNNGFSPYGYQDFYDPYGLYR